MKLYTEEQVIEVFEKYGNMSAINARNILDLSESIELPSDEEMSVRALKTISELNPKLIENEEAFYIAGFVECAKWMREKIQGGNNEQR